MAEDEITVEELAEFLQRQLPATFDIFDKHRAQDRLDRNHAHWARGRVDAFLQIMELLDKPRRDMLRTEWIRVVTGESFVDGADDGS